MLENTPNLFVAGFSRTGTTWLYHQLIKHTNVYLPEEKEPHFFTKSASEQLEKKDDYLALYQDWNGQKIIGDTSTTYINWLNIAPQLKEYSPNSKIIISLRNPLERMQSFYYRDRHLNKTKHPRFESTIKSELQTLPSLKEADIQQHRHFWIAQTTSRIKSYLDTYGTEQVLFITHDELKADSSALLNKVQNFLEIEDQNLIEDSNKKINQTNKSSSSSPHSFGNVSFINKLVPNKVKTNLLKKLNFRTYNLSDKTKSRALDILKDDILATSELTQLDHIKSWAQTK